MQKFYILDTNILLNDPMSIYAFEDNIVILTEAVIEEIDKFKKGKDERNINARKVSRELDKLRLKGKLNEGIKINNNGILKFETNHCNIKLPQNWDLNYSDNRILQVSIFLKNDNKPVIIVTNDINMKIKADILDIKTEEYKNTQSEHYTGRQDIYISEQFMNENNLEIQKLIIYNNKGIKNNIIFHPNEYVLIHAIENNNQTIIGKVNKNCKYIDIIKNIYSPYGIKGKNIGQKFIIDALMRDSNDIPFVIIEGGSGTGKSFLTLACGLEQTLHNKIYRKMLITREIETLGKDIGTLPGTEEEKLNPFLRGFKDNLEILIDSDENERYKDERELNGKVQYLFDTEIITAEAITYMRGRSIYNQYIIIDEAQNCTIPQMMGIITRIGLNTKIIILGDTKQIDNVYLNEKNNGLTWVSNLMKDSPYACKITLQDSESVRSPLVKDIIQRINDYKKY